MNKYLEELIGEAVRLTIGTTFGVIAEIFAAMPDQTFTGTEIAEIMRLSMDTDDE